MSSAIGLSGKQKATATQHEASLVYTSSRPHLESRRTQAPTAHTRTYAARGSIFDVFIITDAPPQITMRHSLRRRTQIQYDRRSTIDVRLDSYIFIYNPRVCVCIHILMKHSFPKCVVHSFTSYVVSSSIHTHSSRASSASSESSALAATRLDLTRWRWRRRLRMMWRLGRRQWQSSKGRR